MSALPQVVAEGSPQHTLGELFTSAGYELWLVGGTVRDALIGRQGYDFDFATNAKPPEVLELLRPVASQIWLQGVKFGTIGALFDGARCEITTYREEWYGADSRKPQVTFARDIESDLSRRDFTVNAIAVRTPSAEVFDPFGGIADLLAKVLRTPKSPEQAFTDDPLRMLRACRFAATLDFQVAPDVALAIKAMHERMSIVSAERIADELSKLMVGEKPSRGLSLLASTGLTAAVVPELPALQMEQDPIHRHKDVFAHTLAVIERTHPDLVLRLAALLHDIAKPATRAFGPKGVSFHHHEVVGARMAREILRRLKFSNEIVDDVSRLVELHLRFHSYKLKWTDAAVRRYVRDAGPLLDKLNALVRADCTTRNTAKARQLSERMDELEHRIAELAAAEELDRLRPDVDGFDIMALFDVKPGRVIGDALNAMLELRLDRGPLDRWTAYAELIVWGETRELTPARSIEDAMTLADANRPFDEEEEEAEEGPSEEDPSTH